MRGGELSSDAKRGGNRLIRGKKRVETGLTDLWRVVTEFGHVVLSYGGHPLIRGRR